MRVLHHEGSAGDLAAAAEAAARSGFPAGSRSPVSESATARARLRWTRWRMSTWRWPWPLPLPLESLRIALRGRTVFCLHPHQTAYVVPSSAVVAVPGRRPGRARGPRRHRGDRGSTPGGTPRPSSGTGWPSWARACSAAAWARLVARVPGTSVTLVDVDPGGARRGGGGVGGGLRGAAMRRRAAATWSSTPAPPPRDCSARSSCWRRRAPSWSSAGTATRPPRSRSAAASTPAG